MHWQKSNIDKTYSVDIQVHLKVKYCRFILGKNTCQNHLVQTNIWVLFLYSQLQSMAYSFIQLAVIRDSVFVHPPLIYWSLINSCWALILADFIFWAETPNQMPTEERNITKFVLLNLWTCILKHESNVIHKHMIYQIYNVYTVST